MHKKYYRKKHKYKRKKRGQGYLGKDKWSKWFTRKQKGGGKKIYQSGRGEWGEAWKQFKGNLGSIF